MHYEIPSVNFPKLEKQISALNKRCKANIDPLTLKIVETFKRDRRSLAGFNFKETVFLVELVGESPTLAGWTLVAIIQPVDGGENIIREVPSQSCPVEYRQVENICDHCGKHRKRKSPQKSKSQLLKMIYCKYRSNNQIW